MSDSREVGQEQNQAPFIDGATYIPLDQATHFERDGFTGDILVPKEAALGFMALQVNVDGEHPLKRMLRGTTRTYYVVDGSGTFTLNGEEVSVDKGGMVVIQPGNEYSYKGTMTLFEVNVSPNNSFKDRKVEPPKESRERNPDDHHTANPQREKFGRAIAEIIKRGYTLTKSDVGEILPHYGFSTNSPASSIINSPNFRKIVAANGATMVEQMYKHRIIITDGNLLPEETDIANVKAKIDDLVKKRP